MICIRCGKDKSEKSFASSSRGRKYLRNHCSNCHGLPYKKIVAQRYKDGNYDIEIKRIINKRTKRNARENQTDYAIKSNLYQWGFRAEDFKILPEIIPLYREFSKLRNNLKKRGVYLWLTKHLSK